MRGRRASTRRWRRCSRRWPSTGETMCVSPPFPSKPMPVTPDFRLWNGTDRIIGYVEAKKPTEDRLDVIEESEQLTRYRSTFPQPDP